MASPEHEGEIWAPLGRGVHGPGTRLLCTGIEDEAPPPFGKGAQPSRHEDSGSGSPWALGNALDPTM